MQKVKIGFVPSTWESWDGSAYTGKLAGKMRARCLEAFAKIPGLEIVVPSEELTQDGCVGTVEEGMKAGDIDPRCQARHCFTVSDKARAIGGGVLEGLLYFGRRGGAWNG